MPKKRQVMYSQHGQVLSALHWVSKLNSPLWDEVIVTTLLSKGWSLGVLFLVRPDTMLISLIRLSSNRNTDSFSWSATRQSQSCFFMTRAAKLERHGLKCLFCTVQSPSQGNKTEATVSSVWCWMTKQPPTLAPCSKDDIGSSSWWCDREVNRRIQLHKQNDKPLNLKVS